MIQGNRQPDDRFRPKDQLYRRCKIEEIIDGHLTGVSLRLDDMSTNWSKYSKPWDVIFDYPGYGIARFRVLDLPTDLPTEDPPGATVASHSFRPQHRPCQNNYAHTEIWAFSEGQRKPRVNSNTVKKEFRQLMSDRSLVLYLP